MRKFISAALFFSLTASAQNTTTENIIEGGKAIVELVKVLKMPAITEFHQPVAVKTDSCVFKNTSDLCFKNLTAKTVYISLYKRAGNIYEPNVLSITILPKNQECWYEIMSGIYKYKIAMKEEDDDEQPEVYSEGEMKLTACKNLVKEIKF